MTLPFLNGSPFISRGLFGDGASAAPAISFASDTGTGFFRQSAGVVGLTGGLLMTGAAGGAPAAGVINAAGLKINGVDVSTSSDTFWTASGSGIAYTAGPVSLNGVPTGDAGDFQCEDLKITGVIGDSANGVRINRWSDAVNYGAVVFNGIETVAGSLGIGGGAVGDPNLYLNAPTGGILKLRINGANAFDINASGVTASGVGTHSFAGKLGINAPGPLLATFQRSGFSGGLEIYADSNGPIVYPTDATDYLQINTGGDVTLVLAVNHNALFGTLVDSGNGRIQLATHTTNAGGIGFGTDVSLFRPAAGFLQLDGANYAGLKFRDIANGSSNYLVSDNGFIYIGVTDTPSATNDALKISNSKEVTPIGRLVLPMGEINYFSLVGTLVNIAAQSATGTDNAVKVAPVTTLGAMAYEFDNGGANNGRLRYTGAQTRHFHVAASVSFGGGANDTFTVMLAKGGVVVSTSTVAVRKMGAGGDVGSTALHGMVELATNEYLEVFVANTSDTDDPTFYSVNLFALGM